MAKKSKMKLPINEVLGVVAGAVAAGFVSKLVNDKLPNVPGIVKALIPIGAGIFLTGNKNTMLKGVGFGMVAKGGAGRDSDRCAEREGKRQHQDRLSVSAASDAGGR